MSTLKVNEIRHLSNSGDANLLLASSGATTLKATSISALTVESITATSNVNLNGNTQVGNASSDTLTLTATGKGSAFYAGFTGEIRMWSATTAPTTWLICVGETIGNNSSGATHTPTTTGVASLQTLFDHVKASFGNSGNESYSNNNTVKLPDFKGRMAIGVGQQANVKWNSGASDYTTSGTNFGIGATGGFEEHVITIAQMASHNHTNGTHSGTAASQTTGATVGTTLSISAKNAAHTHTLVHTHVLPAISSTTATPSVTLTGSGGGETITSTGQKTTGGEPGGTHVHDYAHTHTFWGDDGAHLNGGYVRKQHVEYDAESSGSGQGGHYYTKDQDTTTTGTQTGDHAHNVVVAAHTHGLNNHTHSITIAARTTSSQNTNTTSSVTPAITVRNSDDSGSPSATSTVTDSGHAHTLSVNAQGDGTPHNNLQPYLAINYIIKI